MSGYTAVIASPLPGRLRLGLRLDARGRLEAIDFLPASHPLRQADSAGPVRAALERFFQWPGRLELPPLAPVGTPFQQRVWAALCEIPAGQTRSYGALAEALGSAARAVAGACRANPIPLLIPCHRVVAIDGIGGYGGATAGANIAVKQWLLEHERGA